MQPVFSQKKTKIIRFTPQELTRLREFLPEIVTDSELDQALLRRVLGKDTSLKNENQRSRRQQRKQDGLCYRCKELALPNGHFCFYHWIYARLRSERVRGSEAKELIQKLMNKLSEQNHRCPYSGELLVPGLNCSLDHRIPLSRGGTNEIENLQWVTIAVNIQKGQATEEEFLNRLEKS